MTDILKGGLTRRDLLATTGKVAAASALAGVFVPAVHAGEDHTIQVALVGCGGRGTGAAENALKTKKGPVKLVAMADVFEDRLKSSYESLSKDMEGPKVEVPEDRRFIGFDGYKKAMDCLKKGDVVILTTPPAFRHVHFRYAIDKGLNVFMEKPVTVDGPTTKKMLALGEESVKKGLKVGVGLMCRHCPARRELFEKIKDGALGDITLLRAYRVAGPTGSAFVHKMPEGEKSELLYQIRHFHGFLWASGGAFSDFLIHNIDECCWMKDAWPVSAKGYGGRHYRMDVRNGKEFVDQNFDVYTCEYTFADGSKLMLEGRGMVGCDQEFASYAHGTKGSAVISASSHWPSRCRISKTQDPHPSDKSLITWSCGKEPSENNPYQVEWEELMEAIRQDKPYNEVKRGAEASVVTSMGRMACHTGKIVTLDQMLSCDHEFAPTVGELTLDGPSPLKADKDGRYPTPRPGLIKREYEVKVS